MSKELIDRNDDLKRLIEARFAVSIFGNFLIINNVPYLDEKGAICSGSLVSSLQMVDGKTVKPSDHKAYFKGGVPHKKDGLPYSEIIHSIGRKVLTNGLEVDLMFSTRPKPHGYTDYYHKMNHLVSLLTAQAAAIEPSVTARGDWASKVERGREVFAYSDTNATRAGISLLSEKFVGLKIGIVGAGGTGSYVLDLVAKTCVDEIHLFDSDEFKQHNSFRTPGAASSVDVTSRIKKVDYLKREYGKMHLNITAHPYRVEESNLSELFGLNFVFVCVDDGLARKIILEGLSANAIRFIDVGIGVHVENDKLLGMVRTTSYVSGNADYLQKYVDYSSAKPEDDDYNSKIQIADINALNAALAVMRWKRMMGYYKDTKEEANSLYTTSGNFIANREN